jgi:peptide-methionine (R)-S-oxide reductase
MLSRRIFLTGAALTGGAGVLALTLGGERDPAQAAGAFEIVRSDAEWRAQLTPAQYAVLRKEGTERAFSSPLDTEKRAGTFHCAGCDLPVYASTTKFDSRTGWPSFWASLDNAVGTKTDRSFLMTRTEVHCRRCGGHLGHIFDDGPPPTGKRHCLNGVALKFVAA